MLEGIDLFGVFSDPKHCDLVIKPIIFFIKKNVIM